ncbi:hypothetical protein MRB53_026479 [Persea americana]|uniref:Uncharacterized protein n=1 Tax=Persea americana TaxID=3435 RepID=A0ACC2LIH6_PERAE|nr:hypothetical protein MRB53_026479 [Persea americana]
MKELVKNNLDAGASPISVVIKVGGLKFVQVSNNGHDSRVRTLCNSNAFFWISSIRFQCFFVPIIDLCFVEMELGTILRLRWRMMGRKGEMCSVQEEEDGESGGEMCSLQEEEDGESGSAGKKMELGGDGL